jgi:hypothetical protein
MCGQVPSAELAEPLFWPLDRYGDHSMLEDVDLDGLQQTFVLESSLTAATSRSMSATRPRRSFGFLAAFLANAPHDSPPPLANSLTCCARNICTFNRCYVQRERQAGATERRTVETHVGEARESRCSCASRRCTLSTHLTRVSGTVARCNLVVAWDEECKP